MGARPKTVVIACQMGNLTWTTARRDHNCVFCGKSAAREGEQYLRNQRPDDFVATEAICLDCGWQRFGPEEDYLWPTPRVAAHTCGRGCLMDGDSADWHEIESQRGDRVLDGLRRGEQRFRGATD